MRLRFRDARITDAGDEVPCISWGNLVGVVHHHDQTWLVLMSDDGTVREVPTTNVRPS